MSEIYNEPLIEESGGFLLAEDGSQLATETDLEVADPGEIRVEPATSYNGVKNFIMRRMGFPRVKVYMTEEQLDDCIWLAINRYFEYKDLNMQSMHINAMSGTNSFDVPPTVVPEFIHEVIFKPSDPLLSMTGVMQDVYLMYYMQNAGGASNFIVDYWMALASYEEYTRVLGNQPHWELLNGKIYVYPTPSIAYNLVIKYMELPSESVIENIRWIREYSLAQSKLVEGEIRSKFSSFSAGSGEISLNGDSLKAEGDAAIMKLEDELFSKQIPLGMIIG